MLQDLFAFVISTFVIAPFEAEMKEKLALGRAPQAVIAEMQTCVGAAAPVLGERLLGDWRWVVTSTVGIWMGSTTADAVLGEAVPQCREALTMARPFLAGASEA